MMGAYETSGATAIAVSPQRKKINIQARNAFDREGAAVNSRHTNTPRQRRCRRNEYTAGGLSILIANLSFEPKMKAFKTTTQTIYALQTLVNTDKGFHSE
jgi:hypothetical protein